MAFSLRARVVYPVDRAPIEHGVVTLDGEQIVAVGTLRSAADELRDLGDVALLPGLVNAHTHLEFSHLRRPLGTAGMRLADWIRLVIAERSRGDVRADESVAAGLAEGGFEFGFPAHASRSRMRRSAARRGSLSTFFAKSWTNSLTRSRARVKSSCSGQPAMSLSLLPMRAATSQCVGSMP